MAYILHRNVAERVVLSRVHGKVLRIGRGTNADIRSDDATVALEHAVIERTTNGYVLTDRGSITGTYVNGKPVEHALLNDGDVIEIGGMRLKAQVTGQRDPLFLRIEPIVSEEETSSPDEAIPRRKTIYGMALPAAGTPLQARKIDFVRAYQLRRRLFGKALIVLLMLAGSISVIGWIVASKRQAAFRPGGVSSAHKTAAIANDCNACHTPWKGVSDERCIDCHAAPEHHPNQAFTASCISCHSEHREMQKLASVGSDTCTECHAKLTVRDGGKPQFASTITSFAGDHPEFAVNVIRSGAPTRVRLNDPSARKGDATLLAFNHALHLDASLRDARGKRVQLACTDCHTFTEARGQAEPAKISFDRNCRSCHLLTFDPRFPDMQVPHGGDPGTVYATVLATFSGNRDIIGRSPDEIRRALARRSQTSETVDQRAFFAAEQVIKTKCAKCHALTQQERRLAIVPPVIPDRWLQHGGFAHKPHMGVDCTSCHRGAEKSIETADVLLPGIAVCRDCHKSEEKFVLAAARGRQDSSASCLLCHVYHSRSKSGSWSNAKLTLPSERIAPIVKEEDGRGGIARVTLTTLAWFIAALLLFGVIGGAIAALQRRRAAAAAERAAASAMQRASAARAPQPQAAAPAPPQPPDESATVVMSLDTIKPAAPAEGTVAVQWYGALRATSGAIKGLRLPIDETGFSIGRDGDLSQVVIDDSRISRRHVWIGVRGGEVVARDEGSTNGTFLNDPKARITDATLKPGDRLILGESVVEFVYEV